MKFTIILTFYVMTIPLASAQNSGSGILEWWQSTCMGVTCDQRIDNEDLYQIVAPAYGSLEITGQVSGLTTNCHSCPISSNPIVGGVISNCAAGLGSFGTSPTTFTIDCMKPGDSVCLRFYTVGSGYYGGYSFTSTFTPADPQGNEIEPNNTMQTAQSISVPYQPIQGHIYYGLGGLNFVDGTDYYEIGFFQPGDSIHLQFLPAVNSGFCQLLRQNAGGPFITLSSTNTTGYYIVTIADIYYVRVNSTGNADCTPYTIEISGDPGRREYLVSENAIEIDYDANQDLVYIYGDFTNKSLEVINTSNTVISDLSGMNSPIIYDTTTLPSGKHFLVIRDDSNNVLRIQDLIKE